MIYKLQRYDMIVKDVVGFEMRALGNSFVGDDNNDWINIYYALYKENAEDPKVLDVAWSRNIAIPFDIFLLDRKFKRGEHTQADVDILNGFFVAIGSPEIKVLLDQTDPVPPEEEGEVSPEPEV